MSPTFTCLELREVVIIANCEDFLLTGIQISYQLGLNHVCVILSHRGDTSFEGSFRPRKKYRADVLSLDPCNTLCICSKFPFQIIFRAKKI